MSVLGPMTLEIGLGALMLVVLLAGIFRPATPDRRAGFVTLLGLIVLAALSFTLAPTGPHFGGSYVVDALALFAKRLFLVSAAISVLASLSLPGDRFARRGAEYHFALLSSLLGMLVLASARDLVLLFVAFELMSIPLYFLTGFQKKEDTAGEGALKFFLVGSVSSAVLLYGFSFLFGATGSTDMGVIAVAVANGNLLARLGLVLALAGLGFKIAAVPFHMWVPDTYEAATTPFVAWLSVAPKAAGFIVIFRLYFEGASGTALVWVPLVSALASLTIVAGNLMAIPQTNVKRMLAYSGVAHIGYMLMGVAAVSTAGVGMVLFYLMAYLFGNMGAFLVVQAVGTSEGSDKMSAYRGLAQRSPVLALSLLVFLLSLGGIPFVAGFWAKLFIFRAVVDQHMYGLALLGAVATIVALYYYLVLSSRMYVEEPEIKTPVIVPMPLLLAILICAIGTVVMGVYPEPWVRGVMEAARGLF
ncbi:MAG: NADH-quinone oxidoreductase subunit N, partial [Vicinamibacteria bacterium]|nr:NADH-quinone oxidoreductase subunit N [Vicinamibacteria bacterium]